MKRKHFKPHKNPKRGKGLPKPRIKVHFLGSAGEVTGSLILVEVFFGNFVVRFLFDVGLHQDNEAINRAYRLPHGIRPRDIDFIIISHAHIDHSGYLPKLVRDGFCGRVYTHRATKDLLRFMLADSARLQELAARLENERNGLRDLDDTADGAAGNAARFAPNGARRVYPLYTTRDAYKSMRFIKCVDYDLSYRVHRGIRIEFSQAAHILGAAVVSVTIGKGHGKRTICFTGNVGRDNMPFLKNLAIVREADYVISESTYGDKLHEEENRLAVLKNIINGAYERALPFDEEEGCGLIVIPAFAVSRVQTVLYDLRTLEARGDIPKMEVFLDSRMAIKATEVHRKHRSLYNDAARRLVERGIDPFRTAFYTECIKRSQSRLIDVPARKPRIVIGSSGMGAGGRILHHLERRLPSGKNTVIFVGYQGTGFLGHTLVNEKPREVLIHGNVIPVNATIEFMHGYSGHRDYKEMIGWFARFRRGPRMLFLVHGDKETLPKFKQHINQALPGLNVVIPRPRQCFVLD